MLFPVHKNSRNTAAVEYGETFQSHEKSKSEREKMKIGFMVINPEESNGCASSYFHFVVCAKIKERH
jgi:hypothetical protein